MEEKKVRKADAAAPEALGEKALQEVTGGLVDERVEVDSGNRLHFTSGSLSWKEK